MKTGIGLARRTTEPVASCQLALGLRSVPNGKDIPAFAGTQLVVVAIGFSTTSYRIMWTTHCNFTNQSGKHFMLCKMLRDEVIPQGWRSAGALRKTE